MKNYKPLFTIALSAIIFLNLLSSDAHLSAKRSSAKYIKNLNDGAAYLYLNPKVKKTQKTRIFCYLAGLGGVNKNTIKRYIPYLKKNRWLGMVVRANSCEGAVETFEDEGYKVHNKIFVLGFSAGGRAAMIDAFDNAHITEAAVIHCPGNVDTTFIEIIKFNLGAADIPVFFSCGKRDSRYYSMRLTVDLYQRVFARVPKHKFYRRVGHSIPKALLRDAFKFYKKVASKKYKNPRKKLRLKGLSRGEKCMQSCNAANIKNRLYLDMAGHSCEESDEAENCKVKAVKRLPITEGFQCATLPAIFRKSGMPNSKVNQITGFVNTCKNLPNDSKANRKKCAKQVAAFIQANSDAIMSNGENESDDDDSDEEVEYYNQPTFVGLQNCLQKWRIHGFFGDHGETYLKDAINGEFE